MLKSTEVCTKRDQVRHLKTLSAAYLESKTLELKIHDDGNEGPGRAISG